MAKKIYPYKAASESAKALAEALGIRRIKQEGSKYVPKRNDVIINWGSSELPAKLKNGNAIILNSDESVKKASNKLLSFEAFKAAGVPIPEFTTKMAVAQKWIIDLKATVVARTILNGHSGEGIVLVEHPNVYQLPRAPLYTEYVKKVQEYRLHVFRDNVFFIQRKARKKEIPDEEINWQVRNHANGFIFAHQDVDVPDDHKKAAVGAVKCLGLDFGAVDLIVTKKGECFVLEVNTACGLEGTTLEKYCEVLGGV